MPTSDWLLGRGRRARVVVLAVLAALYAVALVTLPVADSVMRERAVEHGWIEP